MDSVREININVKKKAVTADVVKEAAVCAAEAVKTFFQFLLYMTEYAISAAYRFVSSKQAAYVIGKYKKAIIGVSAGIAVFAAVGIVGGMEAGLISFGVGVPLAAGLFIAFRLLGRDR